MMPTVVKEKLKKHSSTKAYVCFCYCYLLLLLCVFKAPKNTFQCEASWSHQTTALLLQAKLLLKEK